VKEDQRCDDRNQEKSRHGQVSGDDAQTSKFHFRVSGWSFPNDVNPGRLLIFRALASRNRSPRAQFCYRRPQVDAIGGRNGARLWPTIKLRAGRVKITVITLD
jgi:hypothetical protein